MTTIYVTVSVANHVGLSLTVAYSVLYVKPDCMQTSNNDKEFQMKHIAI